MLEGIHVLDLSSVGPAARASRWLADYGARVTKVKPRDATKQITPPFYAYSAHRGMDSVEFDLPADGDAFLDLAADADVIIESFRPGVVDRLGVGYDAVKARNPRVVYCSTTGFGQTGPRAQGGRMTSTNSGSAATSTAPARRAGGDDRRQRRRWHARGDVDPRRAGASAHTTNEAPYLECRSPTACSP